MLHEAATCARVSDPAQKRSLTIEYKLSAISFQPSACTESARTTGSRTSPQPLVPATLALYSLASWFSLFWINGILSWQLTPDAWIASHDVWAGFFNPTFWPALLFRTLAVFALMNSSSAI